MLLFQYVNGSQRSNVILISTTLTPEICKLLQQTEYTKSTDLRQRSNVVIWHFFNIKFQSKPPAQKTIDSRFS